MIDLSRFEGVLDKHQHFKLYSLTAHAVKIVNIDLSGLQHSTGGLRPLWYNQVDLIVSLLVLHAGSGGGWGQVEWLEDS